MKILLTITLCVFSLVAFGQVKKGSFLISGNMSYSYSQSSYNFSGPVDPITNQQTHGESIFKSSNYYLSPKVGYFILNKFCVGLSLPADFSRSKQTLLPGDYVSNRNRCLGVGSFVRYYIPLNQKFFILTQVGYSRVYKTSKLRKNFSSTQSDQLDSSWKGRFDAGIGVSYFINKNIGVEILGSYYKETNPQTFTWPEPNNVNFAMDIGLQIYLSK